MNMSIYVNLPVTYHFYAPSTIEQPEATVSGSFCSLSANFYDANNSGRVSIGDYIFGNVTGFLKAPNNLYYPIVENSILIDFYQTLSESDREMIGRSALISEGDMSVDAPFLPPVVTTFSVDGSQSYFTEGDVITISATVSKPINKGDSIRVSTNLHNDVVLTASKDGVTLAGQYSVVAGDDVSALKVINYEVISVTSLMGTKMISTRLPVGSKNLGGESNIVVDPAPTLITGFA